MKIITTAFLNIILFCCFTSFVAAQQQLRQPLDNGFVFRVNVTATYFDQRIYPGLGLSFGFVLD